jgi:hypothetical protein
MHVAAGSSEGLSFFTNAVFGRNAIDPISGMKRSDMTECDFTLDDRFTASRWPEYLAPLWIRARAVRAEEKLNGFTAVTNDYRVILNYQWVLRYK